MKIRSAALLAATLFLLSSCNWFRSDRTARSNPLIGQWRVDSLSGDDSAKNGFPYLVLAMAMLDSSDLVLEFTPDSLRTITKGKVTEASPYSINKEIHELLIKDSANQKYNYSTLSDSMIILKDKDSMSLFLKRK
jgi:hypothetical protein